MTYLTVGNAGRPAAVLVVVLFLQGCGTEDCDTITAGRRTMVEDLVERGRTRLSKTYPVAMPVSGEIGRIDLEPGDEVKKGRQLAAFDLLPFEKRLLEAEAKVAEMKAVLKVHRNDALENTMLEEMHKAVAAAEDALNASDAELEVFEACLARTKKELQRIRALSETDVVDERALDDAVLAHETAQLGLKRERFNRAAFNTIVSAVRLGPELVNEYIERKHMERDQLENRLRQAEAALELARHARGKAVVRSPIDGVVLERYELGSRWLPEGALLLRLGRPADLEVVVDVLTGDALRIKAEMKAEIIAGKGEVKGAASVQRIEPAGFTKYSALGVEQQRVNVILDLDEALVSRLGAEYRLEVRFLLERKENALVVPRYSVLQAPDETYYVIVMQDGDLYRRDVMIGLRNDREFEILDGLAGSETIVAVPDAGLTTAPSQKPEENLR